MNCLWSDVWLLQNLVQNLLYDIDMLSLPLCLHSNRRNLSTSANLGIFGSAEGRWSPSLRFQRTRTLDGSLFIYPVLFLPLYSFVGWGERRSCRRSATINFSWKYQLHPVIESSHASPRRDRPSSAQSSQFWPRAPLIPFIPSSPHPESHTLLISHQEERGLYYGRWWIIISRNWPSGPPGGALLQTAQLEEPVPPRLATGAGEWAKLVLFSINNPQPQLILIGSY